MYKKVTTWASALALLASTAAYAQWTPQQTRDMMPVPAQVQVQDGKCRLDKDFGVGLKGQFDARLYGAATRFLRKLDQRTGLFLTQSHVTPEHLGKQAALLVQAQRPGKLALGEDESYRLRVDAQGVRLEAVTDLGALRGLETLFQLLEADAQGYYFPYVDVQDAPRFPWRGILVDPARHFMSVDALKRNIDAMAAVKMNVLHWHLTDDQGWRIESKVYPQLHQQGSEGMYYTQDQVREIVAYCADRGIRVVPEFDVPGHATTWVMAFPELASSPYQYMRDKEAGKQPAPYALERKAGIHDATLDPTLPKTYEVMGNFFAEMCALFPDAYMHIGGDENEGKQWDDNPRIQAFMKEQGLKDNHALQNYFNKRLLKTLTAQGKKMIGWDEILVEGLPQDAIIQSWRGKESLVRAAKQGYQVLLSNGYYIDLLRPAADHYAVDPVTDQMGLSEQQAAHILGGEATMWSELVDTHTVDSRIWPRTAVIAERLWSPASVKDVDDMYRRMDRVSLQLEHVGAKHLTQPQAILRNIAGGYNAQALGVLLRAAAPLKFYNRNPGGHVHINHHPMTLVADAATADPVDARRFSKLVEAYMQGDATAVAPMLQLFSVWRETPAHFEPLLEKSPMLKAVAPQIANLARLGEIGQQLLMGSVSFETLRPELARMEREEGGRLQLQVVKPMERLLTHKTFALPLQTLSGIRPDGRLQDWQQAQWSAFSDGRTWEYRPDSVAVAFAQDAKNLYLAARISDRLVRSKAKGRDQVGTESALRLTLSDGQHTFEYLVAANGQLTDLRDGQKSWNGKATVRTAALTGKDKGYVVEIAIPWKELGMTAQSPLKAMVGVERLIEETQEFLYYDLLQNGDKLHLLPLQARKPL